MISFPTKELKRDISEEKKGREVPSPIVVALKNVYLLCCITLGPVALVTKFKAMEATYLKLKHVSRVRFRTREIRLL